MNKKEKKDQQKTIPLKIIDYFKENKNVKSIELKDDTLKEKITGGTVPELEEFKPYFRQKKSVTHREVARQEQERWRKVKKGVSNFTGLSRKSTVKKWKEECQEIKKAKRNPNNLTIDTSLTEENNWRDNATQLNTPNSTNFLNDFGGINYGLPEDFPPSSSKSNSLKEITPPPPLPSPPSLPLLIH